MSSTLIKNFLETGKESLDERLLETASQLRDRYSGKTITYSRNIFIPFTHYCRNNCSYCNFKRDSGEYYFPENRFEELLELARKTASIEVLFTHGEKPEEKHPDVKVYLEQRGFESTIEYLISFCRKALEKGLLPHSNPGITTRKEMKALREVNASQGLMLENASDRLTLPGMPHHHSPGKLPALRSEVLENAGKLAIPFTTGLLIGISETTGEVVDSLYKLKDLQERHGHLQEVIIQPCKDTKIASGERLGEKQLIYLFNTVAIARLILEDVPVQVPPNLVASPDEWTLLLKAGVSDFGGISILTIDHVNPSSPWPLFDTLNHHVEKRGFKLVQRLPVYPRFVNDQWLAEDILKVINKHGLADESGFFNARNGSNNKNKNVINIG
ncbi:MAG: 7,8-didemethyl-8-hydroxy-5-deazariboflavin synthase subunit CofG [Candidatus Hodarchaeales archaeon]|jgi:7,8-didemethyl-8-hydroxy-5-deazariboflavin synthase CofG subunit